MIKSSLIQNDFSKKRAHEIMVSIICFAYNHEKYIVQTIEGFLSQKTDFKIEIIVHDDASVDRTAEIIHGYEKRYPDIFRCIFQKENQFSKCPNSMVGITFNKARGKYVALCEGDDFWTDPLKLHKQIAFLETNPAYSLCFHPASIFFEGTPAVPEAGPKFLGPKIIKTAYTLNDLLRYTNFIPTSSVVFRTWEGFNSFPEWFYQAKIGDFILSLRIAQKGKLKFLNEPMSTYRIHSNGLWSSTNTYERLVIFSELYRLFRPQISLQQFPFYSIGLSNIYFNLYNQGLKRGFLFKSYLNLLKAFYFSFPFNTINLIFRLIRQIFKH